MIAVIATLRVKPGSEEEFESVFRALSVSVHSNEDGNLAYQLARCRDEAGTYRVLEIYRDQAALEAHSASDHFRAAGPKLGAVLAGRPEIEYLDAVD